MLLSLLVCSMRKHARSLMWSFTVPPKTMQESYPLSVFLSWSSKTFIDLHTSQNELPSSRLSAMHSTQRKMRSMRLVQLVETHLFAMVMHVWQ